MKLRWLIAISVAGLALCGALLHRHYRRTAAPAATQPSGLKPLAEWQQGIRLDPPRSYQRDQELRKQLRREEKRQRPEEGRN